jgi:hypothetical protein
MPTPVTNRWLAILGLVVLGGIGFGLVRGAFDVGVAGQRAALLLAVLAVLDRVIVPIAAVLIGNRTKAPGADVSASPAEVTASRTT